MRQAGAGILCVLCVGLCRPAWADLTVDNATISAATGSEIANTFNINASGAQVAAALNTALTPYMQQLASVVDQSLRELHLQRFLTAMSNANAGAAKTFAADYASDPSLLTLGFAAAATGNTSGGNGLWDFLRTRSLATTVQGGVPTVGGAVNLAFLLGLNMRIFEIPDLGPIEWSRLTLYGNYGFYGGNLGSLQVDQKTFGVHATYRLIDQIPWVPGGMLRWGGLQVGLGVDYAAVSVALQAKFTPPVVVNDVTLGDRTLETDVSYTAKANFVGDLRTVSIPFEAYTNLQLAYALNLFVGAAVDLNFGQASVDVHADAPISVLLRDTRNASKYAALNPVAHLTYTQQAAPTVVDARAFAGLQLNLFTAAIFAQVNVDTSSNFGVNSGVRLFW